MTKKPASTDDFDLENYDLAALADAGAELALKAPHNGAPLLVAGEPVVICMIGSDSEARRKAERAALDRNIKARQSGGLTADDIDNSTVEILAACTTGWRNMRMGGEVLPYSQKNAVMVYRRFRWIKEQADAFCSDRANFMKASLQH